MEKERRIVIIIVSISVAIVLTVIGLLVLTLLPGLQGMGSGSN